MNGVRRYALIIGYLLLVAFLVAGAFRLELQREQVALESERRSHALCIEANQLRSDITAYLDDLPPLPPPPSEVEDPAVQEFLEGLVRRSESAHASSRFELLECPPSPDAPLEDVS